MIYKKIIQFDNEKETDECMFNLKKGFNAVKLDSTTVCVWCSDSTELNVDERKGKTDIDGWVNVKKMKVGKKLTTHPKIKPKMFKISKYIDGKEQVIEEG